MLLRTRWRIASIELLPNESGCLKIAGNHPAIAGTEREDTFEKWSMLFNGELSLVCLGPTVAGFSYPGGGCLLKREQHRNRDNAGFNSSLSAIVLLDLRTGEQTTIGDGGRGDLAR